MTDDRGRMTEDGGQTREGEIKIAIKIMIKIAIKMVEEKIVLDRIYWIYRIIRTLPTTYLLLCSPCIASGGAEELPVAASDAGWCVTHSVSEGFANRIASLPLLQGPGLRACIHIPEEGGNEAEAVRSRFDLRTKCVTRGWTPYLAATGSFSPSLNFMETISDIPSSDIVTP
ncbi:MAG: hypothetical protein R6V03_05215 [Kiritimatiellia bacterium]